MTYAVPSEAEGVRLDRYLASVLQDISRAQVTHWIQDGHVTVGGKTVKPKYAIRHGDVIVVTSPAAVPLALQPEDLLIDMLFEDDDLIVVNKPAGMIVHPGAGQTTGTLVNALLYHASNLSGIGGVERPGIVHRLDKGTSGVMVVAKNDRTHRALSEQFAARTVNKTYLALCFGRLVGEGTIDLPLGRHPTDRKKMSTRSRNPKPALSHWSVQESFATLLSLATVRIATGRTHQIRVHMHAVGHSLVGDPTYGGKTINGLPQTWQEVARTMTRPALHAWKLQCVHPTTREMMTWEAPLADDFHAVLEALRAL